jgi:hypothetical protein
LAGCGARCTKCGPCLRCGKPAKQTALTNGSELAADLCQPAFDVRRDGRVVGDDRLHIVQHAWNVQHRQITHSEEVCRSGPATDLEPRRNGFGLWLLTSTKDRVSAASMCWTPSNEPRRR